MKTFFGMIAVLIAGSLYGCLNSFVKLAYNAGYSFTQVTFIQYIYGAIGLAIFVLVTRSIRPVTKKTFFHLCVIGILGLGGTSLFLYASLNYVPASISLVLLFQFTWISLIIERLVFKKRVKPMQVISVIFILIGTLCVMGLKEIAVSHFSIAGILLGLAAAVCYSIFLIGSSVLPKTVPPSFQSFIMVSVNAVLLFFAFAPFQQRLSELNPFSGIWLWGLVLGVMGQFLPTLLITYGAPIIGGTMTSILGSIELPIGVIASALMLNEKIGSIQWLGILLILGGILISQIKIKRRTRLRGESHV